MPDNLVPLREGGADPLTAFVHPASGLATAFRRLVPHLAGRGGVVAFENLEPGPADTCSIGALAEDYWDQLRPSATGPLVLAGWSFGGPVALHVAALAAASGRDVRAVVLIDSGTPELLGTRADTAAERLAGLFELDAAAVADLDPAIDLDVAVDEVARRLTARHGTRVDAADLRPFVDVYWWHLAAARAPWRPEVVTGAEVVLVRARDEVNWRDVPTDLGWSAVLGAPPPIAWTPGTHYDLMSARHAPSLADLLNPLLTDRFPEPVARPLERSRD